MSDIRKTLQKLDEMTSGAVASVAMPIGEVKKRVEEKSKPEKSPKVDTPRNFGDWSNPSLSGVKSPKKKKVAESVDPEDEEPAPYEDPEEVDYDEVFKDIDFDRLNKLFGKDRKPSQMNLGAGGVEIKEINEDSYEDNKIYVLDASTGEVIDEFDRYSEIPLRLMGYDGAHVVKKGSELNGKEETEMNESIDVGQCFKQMIADVEKRASKRLKNKE